MNHNSNNNVSSYNNSNTNTNNLNSTTIVSEKINSISVFLYKKLQFILDFLNYLRIDGVYFEMTSDKSKIKIYVVTELNIYLFLIDLTTLSLFFYKGIHIKYVDFITLASNNNSCLLHLVQIKQTESSKSLKLDCNSESVNSQFKSFMASNFNDTSSIISIKNAYSNNIVAFITSNYFFWKKNSILNKRKISVILVNEDFEIFESLKSTNDFNSYKNTINKYLREHLDKFLTKNEKNLLENYEGYLKYYPAIYHENTNSDSVIVNKKIKIKEGEKGKVAEVVFTGERILILKHENVEKEIVCGNNSKTVSNTNIPCIIDETNANLLSINNDINCITTNNNNVIKEELESAKTINSSQVQNDNIIFISNKTINNNDGINVEKDIQVINSKFNKNSNVNTNKDINMFISDNDDSYFSDSSKDDSNNFSLSNISEKELNSSFKAKGKDFTQNYFESGFPSNLSDYNCNMTKNSKDSTTITIIKERNISLVNELKYKQIVSIELNGHLISIKYKPKNSILKSDTNNKASSNSLAVLSLYNDNSHSLYNFIKRLTVSFSNIAL